MAHLNRIWIGLAVLSATLLTPMAAARDCVGLSVADDPCVGIYEEDPYACTGAFAGGVGCAGRSSDGTFGCVGFFMVGGFVYNLVPSRCTGVYWDSNNLVPECAGLYMGNCIGLEPPS
jgi:hypothetical protein